MAVPTISMKVDARQLTTMRVALGERKFLQTLKRVDAKYSPVLRRVLGKNTPRRTGQLSRGWRVFPQQKKVGVVVINPHRYTAAVERGAKPRDIRSKKAHQLLVFRKGKGPISAFRATAAAASKNFAFISTKNKPVRWPGFKGRFMLRRSLRRTIPEYPRIAFKQLSFSMRGKFIQ